MAIAARMIVNSVIAVTSFKMYDLADAIIMLHESPELPIDIGSTVISTFVFKTGE